MNDDDKPTPPGGKPKQPISPDRGAMAPPAAPPPQPLPTPIRPMPSDAGLVSTFETLLKQPASLLESLLHGDSSSKLVRNLLFTSVICLAIFGIIIGTHATGNQLWAAPLKITLGMIAAGLICLPSLYIFSCLNGLDVRISAVAGLLFATICMISMLLLGFAPVVWIFSQSTHSVVFMGGLALAFWAIAAFFGMGLITRTADHLGVQKRGHLVVWMGIFVLVALQMSTSLRPIVGSSDRFLTAEKKFFLTHWADQMQLEADRDRIGKTSTQQEQ